ncbi:MAG: hypothetical protein MK202_08480 [Tenacibaculum sp.]|nr:hypothetical protein [Tenacibaculum sp.]
MKNLTSVEEGKTLALISHFWFIGTVIAWILNLKKQNEFTRFYVRQMLGWDLLAFLNGWLIYSFLGGFIKWIIGVILVLFWIISFIGCLSGDKKLIPVFGEHFQDWFKSL